MLVRQKYSVDSNAKSSRDMTYDTVLTGPHVKGIIMKQPKTRHSKRQYTVSMLVELLMKSATHANNSDTCRSVKLLTGFPHACQPRADTVVYVYQANSPQTTKLGITVK